MSAVVKFPSKSAKRTSRARVGAFQRNDGLWEVQFLKAGSVGDYVFFGPMDEVLARDIADFVASCTGAFIPYKCRGGAA